MDSSVFKDLETQESSVKETLNMFKSIKEKVKRLESEKNEALKKCQLLEATIDRLKNDTCSDCIILHKTLNKERIERDKMKKEEKTKLLKTIAKTLENLNDGTNAQQLFTQLVFDGLDSGQEKRCRLITDEAKELDVYDQEVVIVADSEDSSNDCNLQSKLPKGALVIPETEMQGPASNNGIKQIFRHTEGKVENENNQIPNDCEIMQAKKKPRCAPMPSSVISGHIESNKRIECTKKYEKNVQMDKPEKGPSIIISNLPDKSSIGQASSWKMKPSFIVDSSKSGKRLKQMTLSLSRPEKKQDISLSEVYNGGVTNTPVLPTDEENDVVPASPEHVLKSSFSKKTEYHETIEDPDLTIFQPRVTSTCLPVDSSFDKLPDMVNSPPYKYRRDTLRGKEKRLKLPGQECDECAEYYKAADLNKTKDLKARMNMCSRHRDKYQIRAHTPPGFWDPVLPLTPEENGASVG